MNASCPHCNAVILSERDGRAKLRTAIVVLHKSGDVEVNCPSCRRAVLLPCVVAPERGVRKAESTPELRLGIPLTGRRS